MSVAISKFKPSANPEYWIRPITACRLSVLLTAARFQTLDERFTNPSGKPFTRRQLTKVMRRLRYLAAEHRGQSVAEAKGYSRDNALYAYEEMFPRLRAWSVNPTPPRLKSLLRDGMFVSISGNVDDVPGSSKLDDRVNPVPHEIGLARLNKAGDNVLVYEPMSPRPFWTPLSDVRKFASEFQNASGQYIAIAFEIGGYTAEARAHAQTEAALARLRRVREERNDAQDEYAKLVDAHDAAVGDAATSLAEVQAARAEALGEAANAVLDIPLIKD